jgi:hypothetical protein
MVAELNSTTNVTLSNLMTLITFLLPPNKWPYMWGLNMHTFIISQFLWVELANPVMCWLSGHALIASGGYKEDFSQGVWSGVYA